MLICAEAGHEGFVVACRPNDAWLTQGELRVALQSNSSIEFAWGEPLRVGAGGLRGRLA